MSILTFVGWLTALFWLWHCGVVLHFLYYLQLHKVVSTLPPLNHYPKISIVVPARDEEQKIHRALTSLLALDYPNFEILAVNDRSIDQTGAIMDELQIQSSLLNVIHIKELPERWLGKSHAMHSAAQQATGDYLLFTDGDVIFSKDALKKAMQVVNAQQLDHLALTPRLIPGSYAENSVAQFMGLLFLMSLYPFLISNPKSRRFVGIGAFNLIRHSCYQQIGGFEKIRLEMIDDMGLGREIKRHGFRSQLLAAEQLLEIRWQQNLSGLIRGVEKNSFAALNYSVAKLLAITIVFKIIFFFPYLAIFTLPTHVAIGYAVALLFLHSLVAYIGIKAKVGWHISLAILFSATITLWAIWRSAFLTLKQGGVYWRDTFYSLVLLKNKS